MPKDIPYNPQRITVTGKWSLTHSGFRRTQHTNTIALTRYQAMSVQRTWAPGKAMQTCGLKPIPHSENDLRLTITSKGAKFSGVARCRSQYCLDCAQYAKEQRIEKISNGLTGALLRGHESYFLTLTTKRTANPEEQIEALQSGWKALQDRVSYRLKKQGIKLHFVRGLDVTFRPDIHNVYHCHLHIIVVIDGKFEPVYKTTKKSKRLVYADVCDMFQQCCVDIQCKKGTVAKWEGQRMERIDEDRGISRYLCKFDGIANEVSSFHTKEGKGDSLGWMQLVGMAHKGDERAQRIYVRFLNAVKGKRTISISRDWSELDLPFYQPLEPWKPENEEPEKIDIPIKLSTFWEIRCVGVDAFLLAVFNCVMESNVLLLYDLLDSNPEREAIASFVRTFS